MANRIRGNVFIVDSAMGNTNILAGFTNDLFITSIALWASGSTGIVEFATIDTTDVVMKLESPFGVEATVGKTINAPFGNLKVPVLTEGTAWIYFR